MNQLWQSGDERERGREKKRERERAGRETTWGWSKTLSIQSMAPKSPSA